mgnify:FL=1
MGSEKIGTELQFRHLVAAECLRAGLALASLGLFSAAAAGEIRSPRPGLIVLSTLISWGIAAASVWLGHRMPLKAWRDGIAPAAISLTFAARGGLSAVGIGYVTLGFTVLQLASLLRANRSAISSIEASEDTVLQPPSD